MAVKKSQLYSSIWKSCDELRGGMDASEYKNYVLVLLFMKYVTDKYSDKPYAPIVVPENGSFEDMRRAKGKTDIGEQLNKIVSVLAQANNLSGVIDNADFDDDAKLGQGKDKQERLTNLIAIFENPALDFSQNRAGDDDLLGDAYEYLMRNFATQSGKSKGQFYTPAEVSRVMAQILGLEHVTSASTTIYDPTCGSGSLLLKAADEAGDDITIYGQEIDNSTRALAHMNMILHGNATATIEQGNTLSSPRFLDGDQLKTFDFAVANPPFSYKSWTNGVNVENDKYERFMFGTPPTKNGDYAFLQHLVRSLKSTGRGAIILPHGVLFRGNVEATIRQKIIKRGYIQGIIGLPANLFYGTGIPACIIVIDKSRAKTRESIFMIDASNGFVKDGNKNRLRHQDVHKMVDVFNNRLEIPRYSRIVPNSEIEDNDYNLNIPRYIDTTEPEDIQDIEAHLRGGIPNRDLDELAEYWDVFPTMARDLFQPTDRDGYSDLRVSADAVKPTIFDHDDFREYADTVTATYERWRADYIDHMRGIAIGDIPKDLIETLAEALLDAFDDVSLMNKYDLYQHLMIYWTEVMQDDVYILVDIGWMEGNKIPEMQEITRRIAEFEARREELDKKLEALDAKHVDKGDLLYKAKFRGEFNKKRIAKEIKAARKEGEVEQLTLLEQVDAAFQEREKQTDLIDKSYERLAALFQETLIPMDLLIERYFPAEQEAIDTLTADAEALGAEMNELEEEHGAEGGLLYEAKSDAGNLGKGSAEARLSEVEDDPDDAAEADMIRRYLDIYARQGDTEDHADAARADLHEKMLRRYPALTVDEVKALIIEDKWLAQIADDITSELDRVSAALAGRIQQLAERYATPLPELQARVSKHRSKVEEHLRRMGYNPDV